MSKRATSIDLAELPLNQGQRLVRVLDVQLEPVVLGGQTYQVLVGAEGVEAEVERISGGFMVRLRFPASVYGPCFRCLREVKVEVDAQQEEFVPSRTADWSSEDVSPFVKDLVVDVAGLAREALILGLPSKILCSEECAGLCPSCGGEMHEGSCEGGGHMPDPRWAKLQDLHLE